MEKWDAHTHTVLSPATYESLARFTHYADFVRVRKTPKCAELVNSKGEVQREVEENAYDGKTRLRECDKHGVTVQVLSPTPMMIPDYVDNAQDAADICKILNDDNVATAALAPARFRVLGALPMCFPDLAIAELERLRKLGAQGVEINSSIGSAELDDPAFFPIFAAAMELDMAVFIHPWGGGMNDARLKRNWRAWLIGMPMETALAFDAMRSGGVHERLPELRVMYAHGGGAFPALLGRLHHGMACRPDLFKNASPLDPYDTVRRCGVYIDSLVHDAAVLSLLLEQFGASRIALGSDYPYPLGEMDYPGRLIDGMDLPEAVRERLFSGTAKEWLNEGL